MMLLRAGVVELLLALRSRITVSSHVFVCVVVPVDIRTHTTTLRAARQPLAVLVCVLAVRTMFSQYYKYCRTFKRGARAWQVCVSICSHIL